MSKENNTSGGIGFTSLLLVAFIVLKLCNVINWSWWWVLSPFWIPLGIAIIAISGFGIYFLITRKDKKSKRVGDNIIQKSKWQQRLDKMQAAKEKLQKSDSN
jgi:phosphotransferase system  glucose/maltose/N-acetylglucosamine-specific IIC component